MKKTLKFLCYMLVGTVLFFPTIVIATEPRLFLPTAEHMYGEALFTSAYRKTLEGEIISALGDLEEALRYDPYLVSYYLLRAYCFSLLGDYTRAQNNLELYLEVKTDDPFAKGFLKEINDRKVFLQESLSSGITSRIEIFNSGNFSEKFGPGLLWGPSFTIPGRPALMGNVLALCDTEKGNVWIYTREGEDWSRYYSGPAKGKILRVLPTGGKDLILVFADGTFQKGSFTNDNFTSVLHCKTDAHTLSDATLAGAHLLALADRILGKIQIVDTYSGKTVYSWKPVSSPFEPVSLSSSGPLLAIADRTGNRITVMDLISRKEICEIDIPGHPRSVEWLSSEKLVVLTEERELFEISLKEGKCSSLGTSFPEAWFLFRDGLGKVFVTDTRLFRYTEMRIIAEKGFLTLKYPRPISSKISKNHNWTVQARLIQPLGACREEPGIFQGILGGAIAEIVEKELPSAGTLLEPKAIPEPDDEEFIQGPVRHLLLKPEDLPEDIASLARLGGYAMSNGVVIHLLGDKELPNLPQLRLSEATGGQVILSRDQITNLKPCNSSNLRIALKPSLDLPGDPRASGLFITGRTGKMTLEGRIPFWNAFLSFPR